MGFRATSASSSSTMSQWPSASRTEEYDTKDGQQKEKAEWHSNGDCESSIERYDRTVRGLAWLEVVDTSFRGID